MINTTSLKRFLKRWSGSLFVLALIFCVCTEIPDFCGNGGRYDPATQFCVGDLAYDKCGGSEYDIITQECSENGTLELRQHTVTVINGTVGADNVRRFPAGTVVAIGATVPANHVFGKWTVTIGSTTLLNEYDRTTTFTVPNHDVTVTAHILNFNPTSTSMMGQHGADPDGMNCGHPQLGQLYCQWPTNCSPVNTGYSSLIGLSCLQATILCTIEGTLLTGVDPLAFNESNNWGLGVICADEGGTPLP